MRVRGAKTLRRIAMRARGRLLGGGVVLGWHRVATDGEDPHVLSVDPTHFTEQLDVLERHFQIVPLSEVAEEGRRTRRRLALTFDDGYADLLTGALPALEVRGFPATVFIVSDRIGDARFPWDSDRGGVEGRPLTAVELRELASSRLIEIGAHTLTHPDLTTLQPDAIHREVSGSRAWLENFLGQEIGSFSYPHGGVDQGVREIVASAGYVRACSSRTGLVHRGTDPLVLPRLWPADLDAASFERWLASWTGIGGGR